MLKRVKNVVEKIKFIFKGPDNANISFKSNISMELNQVSKGNAIKQSRPDDNSTYSIHDGLMSIFWTQKVKLFYAALLANNSHCSGVM